MSTEVEKLLNDKNIPFQEKGKDLLVLCLNPEHEDNKPSMRIDRESGLFHCLSCGHKGNLFHSFNRYRNIFSNKVSNVFKSIRELRKASWAGFDLPHDAFFVSKPFRGIPAQTLEKFDAFTTKEFGMLDRIVFPISNNMGIIVGFQGRYLHSNEPPKYLAYPAEVSFPWYPSINKIKPINNSIVLVEGLLDALFLHGQGIENVVSTFGTKSVKVDNILELLTPYMLAGVQKVYLMMDGDLAGRNANEHIKRCIEQKTDLIVEVLPLNEGSDPADMSLKEIINLNNKLTEEH